MGFESHSDSEIDRRRYETLLEVADIMVRHQRALPELFQEMAHSLQEVVSFDFISLSLHGPTLDTVRLHLWEGGGTAAVPVEEVGADTASGWLWQNQQSPLFRGSSRSTER